jgi:hypothetical protein
MHHLRRYLIVLSALAVWLGTGHVAAPSSPIGAAETAISLTASGHSVSEDGAPNDCHTPSHPPGFCSLIDAVLADEAMVTAFLPARDFHPGPAGTISGLVVPPLPYPPEARSLIEA